MSKKIIYLILILVCVAVAIACVLLLLPCQPKEEINSFEECILAGYPVLESYPRQCRTPEGETFVEDIGNELEKIDLIRVSSPRPNQIISSPVMIKGEARGTWFFEGDFPIKLLDKDDNVIGQGFAKTQSEWMTEDFIPFQAELEFSVPTSNQGTLILERDNPSGLPELADELRIPVMIE